MNEPLFDEDYQPTARISDPVTSWLAAGSVGGLREKQAAVLKILRDLGGGTDEQVAAAYQGPPQSLSGLRTRRCELVRLGLVVDSGTRTRLGSGRQAIVWRAGP